jgi:hypothetical protein
MVLLTAMLSRCLKAWIKCWRAWQSCGAFTPMSGRWSRGGPSFGCTHMCRLICVCFSNFFNSSLLFHAALISKKVQICTSCYTHIHTHTHTHTHTGVQGEDVKKMNEFDLDPNNIDHVSKYLCSKGGMLGGVVLWVFYTSSASVVT